MDGKGEYISTNGSQYNEDWKNNNKDGKEEYLYSDGD